MSYIQELRHQVGKRPLIMVGAAIILLNPQNQLLLIKRTDNGCWGIPGGAMEPGETLEETARRETREEIGVKVKELELFGVFSGQKLFYRYPNGAEVFNVTVVYRADFTDEELKVNASEHSDYCFFDINSLPENISPPIKPVLRDFVKRFKNDPC